MCLRTGLGYPQNTYLSTKFKELVLKNLRTLKNVTFYNISDNREPCYFYLWFWGHTRHRRIKLGAVMGLEEIMIQKHFFCNSMDFKTELILSDLDLTPDFS